MFGYGPMMHGFAGYGGGFGFGIIGMAFQLVILLAVIYFVYLMWQKGMRHHYQKYESNHGAKDILAERYARGEINDEEYQRMKNLL